MCGIAGIFNHFSAGEVDRKLLKKMGDVQLHRGPDQEGIHVEPGLGLIHRRLSIIDLSSGRQPLGNEDDSVIVVFNGEIYNYRELTAQLMQAGHVFNTSSDTEVLVHGWEEWGSDMLEKLRGMFAFALWDRKRETLLLARDHIGVKPLYYALVPEGQLIFASEMKALLVHPRLSDRLDARAVEDFFALGYIPDPKTILCDAAKLPPGHYLVCRRGNMPQIARYWDIPFNMDQGRDEESAAAELRQRIQESVRMQLMTEVPLGAFLSGGVDSSSVVAAMSQACDDPVKTCSIAFDDPAFNEAEYAGLVAKRFKTDHYVEQVKADDFDLIDTIAGMYDEPFADSSALPTYRLCQLARKRVTVALSGDGGDENFAGYSSYRVHMNLEKVRGLLPVGMRAPVFGALGRLYPKADWAPKMFRAKRTFEHLATGLLESFARGAMITSEEERRLLFSESFNRSLGGYRTLDVFREHASRAPSDHPLALIQYLDLKIYLPADILTKVDRASMAHSLEVRVPLLDHKLIEWSSNLPRYLQFKHGRGKHLFRRAMEHSLPSEILGRGKMGFSIPMLRWLRGPLQAKVRRTLSGRWIRESGIFNQEHLDRMLLEHENGRRDHSSLIWSLIVFDSYLRRSRAEKEASPELREAV